MFSTSADILNLILSACLVVLTFFLCWAVYYFVVSLARIHRLLKAVEGGVAKAEEVIGLVKDKLKNSSTYLMIFTEVVGRVMDLVREKRDRKKTAKKK